MPHPRIVIRNTEQLLCEGSSFARFCHSYHLLIDEDEQSLEEKVQFDDNDSDSEEKTLFSDHAQFLPQNYHSQRVNDNNNVDMRPALGDQETTKTQDLERILMNENTFHRGKWDKRYRELIEYKREYGHCNVPKRFQDNKQLAAWVIHQRVQHKKFLAGKPSQINQERIIFLEKIDFKWTPDLRLHDKWRQRFQELVEFKKRYNHCNVPRKYHENKPLGWWVCNQRSQFKRLRAGFSSHLTPERVQTLEDMGFLWEPERSSWQEKYNELIEFYKENGHCKVPWKYHPNVKLGVWVAHQRALYKSIRKEKDVCPTIAYRIKALQKINFEWQVKSS